MSTPPTPGAQPSITVHVGRQRVLCDRFSYRNGQLWVDGKLVVHRLNIGPGDETIVTILGRARTPLPRPQARRPVTPAETRRGPTAVMRIRDAVQQKQQAHAIVSSEDSIEDS